MAASSVFITFPKPFTSHHTNLSLLSTQKPSIAVLPRNNTLRVNAIAKKFEPSKVVPQADRVLIRLEELPEKSAGGLLLPKSAVEFERYLMGEVISVGAEVEEVRNGKKVLFSDINAFEVDLGTEARHCFCKAGDLLAEVEKWRYFRRNKRRTNFQGKKDQKKGGQRCYICNQKGHFAKSCPQHVKEHSCQSYIQVCYQNIVGNHMSNTSWP